jgi:hypothetical protein
MAMQAFKSTLDGPPIFITT